MVGRIDDPLWVADATYRGSLFAPSSIQILHAIGHRDRTYTFPRPNVYVSRVKRIRFERETYTSWA